MNNEILAAMTRDNLLLAFESKAPCPCCNQFIIEADDAVVTQHGRKHRACVDPDDRVYFSPDDVLDDYGYENILLPDWERVGKYFLAYAERRGIKVILHPASP